jgi:imidazolonepropionase-like amidohydrolase
MMKGLRNLILIVFTFFLISISYSRSEEQQQKILVITGAKLVDGTGSPIRENMIIVMVNGRFGAIGPKEKVTIPKEAEVIDVKGKTVVPGLIDSHVHFTFPPSEYECLLDNDSIASFRAVHFLHRYLMIGVTTVRDVGSRNNVGIVAKKAFNDGLFVGSRPIVAGRGVTCTGGHGTEHGTAGVVECDGPAEFRRGVRQQLKAGADLIKVLPPYSQEEIKAAVEETHFYSRFVTVHSGHSGLMQKEYYDFVRWAVDAGADCIEHAFAIPDDVIQMMAKKKTYCVPTFSVLLKIADKVLKKYPGQKDKAKRWLDSVEIFRKMKKANVKMGVGTDCVLEDMVSYPWIYFEEIERFVENGYTPMEAIVAATKVNAEICNASDRLGTIEKDKLADLLVIDGDPLQDIKALRNVQIVVQEGTVIKR